MKKDVSNILNYVTVFITGMAVMFLEILGTRIIGPFYGVSLFVWSSLISVTLVSLAIGYYLGGQIADKKDTIWSIYVILGIAASFIAIIPIIDNHVLVLTNLLGIRLGTLISAFLLFALPLTLLGMIGPYVIKLSSNKLDNIGITSGSIFAISTIGSFLGTLLIGFLLLPIIGTRNIIYILSGGLFLLSTTLLVREKVTSGLSISKSSIAAFILFFLVIAISFGFNKTTHSKISRNFEVLYESESLHGKVKVVDDHKWNVRWLMSDSSTIGGRFLKTNEPLFPFLHFLESVSLLNPGAQKALLIGLGAGYLPSALDKHGIVTDVIEIDPQVAFAAKRFFDFDPPGKFIIGDARLHVKELEGKYDYIFHDTFTGGAVPSHLLSVEMIEDLKLLLSDNGIMALAYFGFSNEAQSIASSSVYKTINSVFPHIKTYVSRKNVDPVDIIFLASMHPLDFQNRLDVSQNTLLGKRTLDNLIELEISLPNNKGFVITDDYNPLENLQAQKAEAYRNNIIKLIGNEMLLP